MEHSEKRHILIRMLSLMIRDDCKAHLMHYSQIGNRESSPRMSDHKGWRQIESLLPE
jgi:hypothetical protein